MHSISIILPAYNEEKNIEKVVRNCYDFSKKRNFDHEIIVVNDGSTDRTEAILSKLQRTVKNIKIANHHCNLGYGAALRSGFDLANKEYIFFMDSDGQFDIKDLELFSPFISPQKVLIGFRKNRADSTVRNINAFLYGKYVNFCFGLCVIDINCAFKLFPKRAYDLAKPIKSKGAFFNAELLLKFLKHGFDFEQIEVSHYPRKLGVQSGANIRVILNMFKESWKLRKELL